MNFKAKKIRSAKHLSYIRSLSCIIKDNRGRYCNGDPVIAHHLTHVNDKGGVGLKTGDNWTVPLCVMHHSALHTMGEKTFWQIWGIDAEEKAKEYWEFPC